jgi:hypothetical protein
MENGKNADVVTVNLVRDKVGCAGNNEFARTGMTPDAAEARIFFSSRSMAATIRLAVERAVSGLSCSMQVRISARCAMAVGDQTTRMKVPGVLFRSPKRGASGGHRR